MNIIPSNQTLILANERSSAGGAPSAAVQAALRAASAAGGLAADSVLNRVTIVASHPDASMVYLQADYSSPAPTYRTLPRAAGPPPADSAPAHLAPADSAPAHLAPADSAPADSQSGIGALTPLSAGAGSALGPALPTAYLSSRGARLYADTQNLRGRPTVVGSIDVHA